MNIGGKCGLIEEHISDRKRRGANLIEFHTDVNDFLKKDYLDFKNIKDSLKRNDVICHTVHSPMKNSFGGQCSLSEIDPVKRKENFNLLLKSVEYASYLCEIENPIVVIHPSDDFSVLKDAYEEENIKENNKIFQYELNNLSEIVKSRYSNVRLGLENTMPFIRDLKTGDVVIHTGFVYPCYMKDIDEMKLSNVGHVLDICHALATIRFTNMISGGKSNLTLKSYLDASIERLFLIHLNNLKDLAENPLKHGTPYKIDSEKDLKVLYDLFVYLREADYKNYITIEVLEEDYKNALNYEFTNNAVKEVLKHM